MTEQTWLTVRGLISSRRYEVFKWWRDAWAMWPGATPLVDVALGWAKELEKLNDAEAELARLYYANLPPVIPRAGTPPPITT